MEKGKEVRFMLSLTVGGQNAYSILGDRLCEVPAHVQIADRRCSKAGHQGVFDDPRSREKQQQIEGIFAKHTGCDACKFVVLFENTDRLNFGMFGALSADDAVPPCSFAEEGIDCALFVVFSEGLRCSPDALSDKLCLAVGEFFSSVVGLSGEELDGLRAEAVEATNPRRLRSFGWIEDNGPIGQSAVLCDAIAVCLLTHDVTSYGLHDMGCLRRLFVPETVIGGEMYDWAISRSKQLQSAFLEQGCGSESQLDIFVSAVLPFADDRERLSAFRADLRSMVSCNMRSAQLVFRDIDYVKWIESGEFVRTFCEEEDEEAEGGRAARSTFESEWGESCRAVYVVRLILEEMRKQGVPFLTMNFAPSTKGLYIRITTSFPPSVRVPNIDNVRFVSKNNNCTTACLDSSYFVYLAAFGSSICRSLKNVLRTKLVCLDKVFSQGDCRVLVSRCSDLLKKGDDSYKIFGPRVFFLLK